MLTVYVFSDANLMEESLNLMDRKSHITGHVVSIYGFVAEPLSGNTVGSMIQSYTPTYEIFFHLSISGIFHSNDNAFEDKRDVVSLLFSSFCYKNNRV